MSISIRAFATSRVNLHDAAWIGVVHTTLTNRTIPTVSAETLTGMLQQWPEVLHIVTDDLAHPWGFAAQWCLTADAAARLRAGTLSDATMRTTDAIAPVSAARGEDGRETTLFFGPLHVDHPTTPYGRTAARALRGAQRGILERLKTRGLRVTGLILATSQAEEAVLRDLGARCIADARTRADGRALFAVHEGG